MKIRIIAAGRVRAGPEGMLVDSYLDRFNRSGRDIGLGPATVVEYDAGPGGTPPGQQVDRLAGTPDAILCALDERGTRPSSLRFARLLEEWRNRGTKEAGFLIGGADGIPEATLAKADIRISFGSLVLPHLLARVLLAEQLYRSVSILRGTPYHRG